MRSLMGRHLRLYQNEEHIQKEEFLIQRLHIPAAWIHEAKVSINFKMNFKKCFGNSSSNNNNKYVYAVPTY